MKVLDGKFLSSLIKEEIKEEIVKIKAAGQKVPTLAVVLVGEDPASQTYVANKERSCEFVGIKSISYKLDKECQQEELTELLGRLNNDENIDAILVQLPLPKHLNKDLVLKQLSPEKDVDGLTATNIGLLFSGKPRVVPCTPSGIQEILEYYKIPVEGKKVAVLGRSQLVGLPVAQLMQMMNSTVTICHSKTKNTKEITKEADIVIAAAGIPGLLGKDDIKESAVVIDVGIHRKSKNPETGKYNLCGDVRGEELTDWASAMTPVPGGVGPMTIAMLLKNTVNLYRLNK